jgi:hypothetical protein
MVDYREYSIEDILRTLETVKEMKPVGFKKPLLKSIIQSGFVGIFLIESFIKYRKFVIINIKLRHL